MEPNQPGRFLKKPHTRLGWWAIGFAVASILFIFSYMIIPGGAMIGFICGIIGGILALFVVVRQRERSWLVFLSILPLLWVLVFIIGEFLFPH